MSLGVFTIARRVEYLDQVRRKLIEVAKRMQEPEFRNAARVSA